MSNQHSKHGKRESNGQSSLPARYLAQYRSWLAGLNRGQRIRYRLLQAATAVAVIIIIFYLILRAWIQVPNLPSFGQDDPDNPDISDGISFDGAEIPDIVRSGRQDGIYTFLLAGKDTTSGSTDTILLLSYNTKDQTIYGINLPRDTMINTSSSSKRLNAVYVRNRGSSSLSEEERVEKGMEALKKEVANLTGITPDFYVLVEWEAIGKLVDALGGVEFEVPFDMDYDDPYQDLYIHQKAGLRVLTGDDAMQVIRHRKNNDGSHSNGDVGRLAIQQDFLKAVAKKCLQPSTFLKVPTLAQIFTESMHTDLTLGNILAFAQLAYGMDPETGVNFSTAPLADSFLYKSAALVTLDADGILEVVNNGMNPYLRDIQASDLKVVVRNSNGSFYVTNGDLADSAMAQAQTAPPPSADTEELEPVQPPTPTGSEEQAQPGDEDIPQIGDTSQSSDENSGETTLPSENGDADPSEEENQDENAPPSQDIGSIGAIDPNTVLPDPDSNVSQDAGGEADKQEDSPLTVLPSWPRPAEAAA